MMHRSVRSGSSAAHTFSRAPQANIPRSKFNRSHGIKTTFNEGILIPIFADEMLPGDTFNLKFDGFARMSTPLFPIMDNVYMETFFFAVPVRLLWNNWERFNGFQTDPGDSTDFLVPTITTPAVTGADELSLADYFGIPTKIPNLTFNSLHFRAYNLIYNDWFRDENLQDSIPVDLDDGPDTYTDYILKRRGKRYDYFTSALPFPQKGPDVTIPLGTSAPIIMDGPPFSGIQALRTDTGASINSATTFATGPSGGLLVNGVGATFNPRGDYIVDLSDATAATINDLRLAFQTQKLYERDARGGTRYTEIIRSHFNVTSPDMRLQRPEYLGGGSTPVLVNPIAQTASQPDERPLGSLAAYGVAAPSNHGFVYSSTEHCVVIGLISVRADINYQQGLDRMWSRQERLDFYWPALSHIGEQAILNKEIYAQGTSVDNDVFGYQERYAEYRYKPSLITGLFRSNATASLDAWHLAQDFASLPALNPEFIVEDAPFQRIEAVPTQPDFILDGHFSMVCARPMPTYAVPGQIDRF